MKNGVSLVFDGGFSEKYISDGSARPVGYGKKIRHSSVDVTVLLDVDGDPLTVNDRGSSYYPCLGENGIVYYLNNV